MYDINMGEVTDEFRACWSAAGRHLGSKHESLVWLRAHLSLPIIEHMSFRLGNQIFFVELYDVEELVTTPNNNSDGLISFAKQCNAIPCLFPMKKAGNEWKALNNGWNLFNPISQEPVLPEQLITDETVVMSDWEVQDMAVVLVKNRLEESGNKIMSWQSNPAVYPSIWYEGESGPEYVIVGAVRYPVREALLPSNVSEIKSGSAKMSDIGYFISVSLAAHDDPFDPGQTE